MGTEVLEALAEEWGWEDDEDCTFTGMRDNWPCCISVLARAPAVWLIQILIQNHAEEEEPLKPSAAVIDAAGEDALSMNHLGQSIWIRIEGSWTLEFKSRVEALLDALMSDLRERELLNAPLRCATCEAPAEQVTYANGSAEPRCNGCSPKGNDGSGYSQAPNWIFLACCLATLVVGSCFWAFWHSIQGELAEWLGGLGFRDAEGNVRIPRIIHYLLQAPLLIVLAGIPLLGIRYTTSGRTSSGRIMASLAILFAALIGEWLQLLHLGSLESGAWQPIQAFDHFGAWLFQPAMARYRLQQGVVLVVSLWLVWSTYKNSRRIETLK